MRRRRGVVLTGRLPLAALATLALGGGIALAAHILSQHEHAPFTLRNTLPKMVDDFGKDARVLSIAVGSDGVHYAIVRSGRRLHVRHYGRVFKELVVGPGVKRTRKVRNSERPATAAEVAGARVRLGELDADVVDRLYEKVGFPRQGSGAKLNGGRWLLESGARPFDKFVARYDGSDVRQTQSRDDVFGPAPGAGPGR